MNPEKQRIKIAEACGWKSHEINGIKFMTPPWAKTFGTGYEPPDYLSCLNACHEMEKMLDPVSQLGRYIYNLQTICGGQFFGQNYLATAAQRCESFLKTLGLWEEE